MRRTYRCFSSAARKGFDECHDVKLQAIPALECNAGSHQGRTHRAVGVDPALVRSWCCATTRLTPRVASHRSMRFCRLRRRGRTAFGQHHRSWCSGSGWPRTTAPAQGDPDERAVLSEWLSQLWTGWCLRCHLVSANRAVQLHSRRFQIRGHGRALCVSGSGGPVGCLLRDR